MINKRELVYEDDNVHVTVEVRGNQTFVRVEPRLYRDDSRPIPEIGLEYQSPHGLSIEIYGGREE